MAGRSWSTIWPYFAAGFICAVFLIRPLDRLALGDDVAASLGSRPHLIRLGAAFAAALLAAASAAIAGLLGFLGLVVPHVVRMAGGTSSHTFVVPASALGGAALLAAGDTLARTLRAPIEMPVGPFMVVLGVPLFLWLLRRVGLMDVAPSPDAPLLEARDVRGRDRRHADPPRRRPRLERGRADRDRRPQRRRQVDPGPRRLRPAGDERRHRALVGP